MAGQVKNFCYFFPQATVLLLVSSQARFEMVQLQRPLRGHGCDNVLINPTRSSTDWGNILDAHLINAAYICSRATIATP